MSLIKVSEAAIRAIVREALDGRGPIDVYKPTGPVNVGPVVAKDASDVDPKNPTFVPTDKRELGNALRKLAGDVNDSDVPDVFSDIVKIIKNRTGDDEMKKGDTVESVVRKHVRDIVTSLNEAQEPEPEGYTPGNKGEAGIKFMEVYRAVFDILSHGVDIVPATGDPELDTAEDDKEVFSVPKVKNELERFIEKNISNDVQWNMLADAFVLVTSYQQSNKPGDRLRPDGVARDIADRLRTAEGIKDPWSVVSDYLERIKELVETKPNFSLNPVPAQRGHVDIEELESGELMSATERQRISDEEVKKLVGKIAETIGTTPSSVTNIIHAGMDKLVLHFLFNLHNFGKGVKAGDLPMTLSDIGDIKMMIDKDNVMSVGWPAIITAALLYEGRPRNWASWSKEDQEHFVNLQRGYEIFEEAVGRFATDMNSPEENLHMTLEEALAIALGTGWSKEDKPGMTATHQRFKEIFDEVGEEAGDPRFATWRNFLMYWGQECDAFLDKSIQAYNAATDTKRREAVAQRKAERTAPPPKTGKKQTASSAKASEAGPQQRKAPQPSTKPVSPSQPAAQQATAAPAAAPTQWDELEEKVLNDPMVQSMPSPRAEAFFKRAIAFAKKLGKMPIQDPGALVDKLVNKDEETMQKYKGWSDADIESLVTMLLAME